jgi:serine/threonine-protein kinase
MSAPSPGTVLAGKYRVDRVLGEGGMGVVVAATDLQLERRVAIKFLLPDYAQHHEASQRFLREARASVKIQSEHVARVIDVGTMDSGAPYMVMEFLEGRDLAAVIDEQKLPVEEAVAHVLEACDAIAEAHSVGIVHRDLKPANLFLARQPDGSSRIKVLDFGISKAMMTNTTGIDPSLTRTSSMMGSPLYMSPEQMKSAKKVDPRTDIWALGVILYELLTGKPPFYAESIPELSAKVLLEEYESIRTTRSDVPEALEAVVKRALAKDTGARFPTVADFAHALAPFGPARTRINVERASRVLKITGHTVPMGEPAPAALSTNKASYARTAAAWTDTSEVAKKEEPAKKSGAAKIGAIVAGAVAVAAAIFVMVGRGASSPSPETSAAAPPVPAPVAMPTAAPVAPTPPTPEVAPAPVNSANLAPAVATAAPEAPAPAAAPSKAAAVHSKPPAAKPSSTKAKPEASPDPFSGFGSRK